MNYKIYQGDCLNVLREIPDKTVHCCVTSPPYWGLRDYGTVKWEGGSEECDHKSAKEKSRYDYSLALSPKQNGKRTGTDAPRWKNVCPDCGAIRIDEQLGLEQTPEEYVANMVEVFREVKRVLRDDGTLWLNLGSSYAGSGVNNGKKNPGLSNAVNRGDVLTTKRPNTKVNNFKPKDLIPIPWMVAMALQSDGWWLRSDIIWSKRNPMPASVKDRPTTSHEYIFLLTKSARYFYDAMAIAEPAAEHKGRVMDNRDSGTGKARGVRGQADRQGNFVPIDGKRNKRSVWTVSTKPYKGAHFATFPPALIEPCILAGCPDKCCSVCGAGWVRVVEKEKVKISDSKRYSGCLMRNDQGDGRYQNNYQTIGFQPSCQCNAPDHVPGTVLDPFMGSGTTGVVSLQYERNFIGIELNEEYIRNLAEPRLKKEKNKPKLFGLFNTRLR